MSAPASSAGSPRSSLAKTITIATCAPALVLGYLCFTTSGWTSGEERIDAWSANVQLERHDTGWGATVQPSASTLLHHRISAPSSSLSELTFDLFVEKPMMPRVSVGFVPSGQPDLLLWMPLPRAQIQRTGWNPIAVPFDIHHGLFGAELIALSLSSPQGENLIAVRDARLVSYGFVDRLSTMLSTLFQHLPLGQGGNNFIESPQINGRGAPVIFWLALVLALALLALRRLVLHERLDVAAHAAVTLVAVVALAHLGNAPNSFRNLRDAAALRLESVDLISHVGAHEQRAHGYAWFEPALRDLQMSSTDTTRIYIGSRYVPGISEALVRLVYYALPAQRATDLQQANLALCYGPPGSQLVRSTEWQKVQTLASGIDIYRRVR